MKLPARLSLAFAAAALLPVAALSPLLLAQVNDAFHDELEGRLSAAVRSIESERDRAGADVVRALDETSRSEELQALSVDLALGGDPSGQVSLAGRLMAARGLDVLAILDGNGRVLSSGHLPARVGDLDPEMLALARARPGVPLARFVERSGQGGIERELCLVAARTTGSGLSVVVGRALGTAFTGRIADVTGASVVLATAAGAELASASAVTPPVPAGVVDAVLLRLLPAPPATVRTVALSGDGAPGAVLRVSLPAQALLRVQARVASLVAGLLFAALALAVLLGSFWARRIVRPVAALAEGARAVAGGDLEHQVAARAGGELGELVSAFNRMTSDLRRERERAVVAERVAAWREVARRLAHEIKNPLAPIAMSIETLRDAWRARSPELDGLFESSSGAILEEVSRLKHIVDEFSRFARLPPPRLGPAAPAALLDAVLALHPAPRTGLSIVSQLEPDLPPVLADPDQVTQVLLNLVKNADEALGSGGGTIRLSAFRDGDAVVLAVADDGPGIAPADRERIFEPYFSTKETGTGLGLPIARRIAEEHGGTLAARSDPGRETIFELRLRPA